MASWHHYVSSAASLGRVHHGSVDYKIVVVVDITIG